MRPAQSFLASLRGDNGAPAPLNDKKNKHRCQLDFGVRTRRIFHGGSFGVSGTPPGAWRNSHAKPLDWKRQGPSHSERCWRLALVRGEESDNTVPLVSYRKIDSLDSYTMSCHHLCGCSLTGVSARDMTGLVTDSTPSSVTAGGGVFIAHVVDGIDYSID